MASHHRQPIPKQLKLTKVFAWVVEDHVMWSQDQSTLDGDSGDSGVPERVVAIPPALCYGRDCKVTDYAPLLFKELRSLYHIDTQDFAASLSHLKSAATHGKSGARFYSGPGRRYLLKTIHDNEFDMLRKILPDYVAYLRSEPHSLLPRFIAMFKVVDPATDLEAFAVVMQNCLLTSRHKPHRCFDLKGSKEGRSLSSERRADPSYTLRDLDLTTHIDHIKLEPEVVTDLMEQLKRDCAFLQGFNIMDYSLLVGIHCWYGERSAAEAVSDEKWTKERCQETQSRFHKTVGGIPGLVVFPSVQSMSSLALPTTPGCADPTTPTVPVGAASPGSADGMDSGISLEECGEQEKVECHSLISISLVDSLQEYTLQKKAEKFVKSMFFGAKKALSSVPSEEYAPRFLDFIQTVFPVTPDGITDVTLGDVTQGTVHLTWSPPAANGKPVTHFDIRYSVNGTPHEPVLIDADPSAPAQFSITELPSSAELTGIEVRARNSIGLGPASNELSPVSLP